MRQVTVWFILLAPVLILLVDWWVYLKFGQDYTITGVVRTWAEESSWPEAIFLAGFLLLWLHLFRCFPGEGK